MRFQLKAVNLLVAIAVLAIAVPVSQAVGKSGNDDGHQNRGKVSSFKDGVLTVKRSSGSTVSGKVSSSTKIRCRNRSTGSSGIGTSRNGADDPPNHDAGDDNGGRQGGSDGSGGGSKRGGSGWYACAKSNLVIGARIHEASFRAASATHTFHEVKITK